MYAGVLADNLVASYGTDEIRQRNIAGQTPVAYGAYIARNNPSPSRPRAGKNQE